MKLVDFSIPGCPNLVVVVVVVVVVVAVVVIVVVVVAIFALVVAAMQHVVTFSNTTICCRSSGPTRHRTPGMPSRLSDEFLARDSIYAIARYMPSPVRLSVRLSVGPSVTRVDQSKTVEVRITQLSPQSSPMTLVS